MQANNLFSEDVFFFESNVESNLQIGYKLINHANRTLNNLPTAFFVINDVIIRMYECFTQA
ncbi:hypothetical protein GCM10012290_00360 [Halolactibacillus alkaliphilus]|uniref:Uncharacterized protein n=1 Tax=Halolactibacillus alkaliphilus TaxID=442899 RepID=A0A511WWZ9_9BACI|nr:hypothetical protein HAL01_01030 [Halolactibacillus alkaliphilus]GGN63629.1 hypothetical protein GCM10012290_00360 [Halolactibacillus alkaliphilus]